MSLRSEESPFKSLELAISNVSDIPKYFGMILNEFSEPFSLSTTALLREYSMANVEFVFCTDAKAVKGDSRPQIVVLLQSSPNITAEFLYRIAELFTLQNANVKFNRFYILDAESYSLVVRHLNQHPEDNKRATENVDRELSNEVINMFTVATNHGVSDIHIELNMEDRNSLATIYMRHMTKRVKIQDLGSKQAEERLRFLFKQTEIAKDSVFNPSEPNTWANEFESSTDRNVLINGRYNHIPLTDKRLSAVIRLQPRQRDQQFLKQVDFVEGGLAQCQVTAIFDAVKSSGGHINLSGVTRSGKTTASRSIVGHKIDRLPGNPKIFTIEDPVEHFGATVLNIDINAFGISEEAGRSSIVSQLLRQDPDLVIVGEIRDKIGGFIAMEVFYLGKLSIATLHSPSPFFSIQKMEQIAGWDHETALNPNAIIANVHFALDEVVCPHCSFTYEQVKADPALMEPSLENWDQAEIDTFFTVPNFDDKNSGYYEFFNTSEFSKFLPKMRFRNPNGCTHCKGTNIANFNNNVNVDFSEPGVSRLKWNSEVLISSDLLFTYIKENGYSKGANFYATIYRVLADGAHVGLTTQESAFSKVLNGETCPFYFNRVYLSLDSYIKKLYNIEEAINYFVTSHGATINEGKGFKYSEYLVDLVKLVTWQEELKAQGVNAFSAKILN